MYVTRITTTEDLQRLAPDWNCLASGVPFRTWQWLLNWWKHYSDGKSLFTLAVYDDADILVGLAPWFIEHRGSDGHVIQFLGSGKVCSDYLTILSTPEHGQEVVRALATWLVDAAAGGTKAEDQWDLLDFDGIPVGDHYLTSLVKALRDHGCTCNRRPALNCWRMPLPSSPSEFLNGLKKAHAKKIRKAQDRLFETGRGVVRSVRTADELNLGMQVFVDLHQRRWNHLGKPGCFDSANFANFIHACAADLLAAGMLNLVWLEIDGRPAVAEFLVASADTLYAYQSGLDPSARQHSPGHAIMSLIIIEAIENGCQTVDFLRGDEPYKATWGAAPVKTERLRVASHRIGPQLRNHAWLAGQVMKDWVKQGLTLTGVH